MKSRQDVFFVIDIETTGLAALRGDRIVEIAAVKLHSSEQDIEFCKLVDSGWRMPRAAQPVCGITDSMLAGQPGCRESFGAFRAFVGKSTLIAYNASFERAFLRREFGRLGWSFTNRVVCALELARRSIPDLPDYRLQTVARHLFPDCRDCVQEHRALADARLTARIWRELTATP